MEQVQNDTESTLKLTQKDYLLVTLIGVSFALFSIPILKNLELSFVKLSVGFAITLVVFFAFFANFALWIASIIGRKVPVVFQFAKFGASGAFNTFFDWGILNLLIAATGVAGGIGFAIFKAISFSFATVSSYFWNKYWTFESKKETSAKEVTQFIVISTIGVVINVGLASLIVTIFASDDLLAQKRLANIAAATATIISLLWNFVGYKLWVFKK
ncbi:MAG: GtrA family protein [Candidatus Moranbacteria bacterium]|nr:GtrA family protein [Candidatus Moranbacteria bacterium]